MPAPAVLGIHDLDIFCAVFHYDEAHHDEKIVSSDIGWISNITGEMIVKGTKDAYV